MVQKPFRVLGKYTGSITFGDMVTATTWYIVNKNKTEPLLSGQTAEELGIITFNANPVDEDQAWVNAVSSSRKNSDKTTHWFTKYDKVFKGVGMLKDYEVKLYLDENIKPTAEPPRPVPFHLQKRFQVEIEKMGKGGNHRRTHWPSLMGIQCSFSSERKWQCSCHSRHEKSQQSC